MNMSRDLVDDLGNQRNKSEPPFLFLEPRIPNLDVLVDLLESTVYLAPDDMQPPPEAEDLRKGGWNPARFHERERNFCQNFISGKSYNRKADIGFERARKVLTWFRVFTRNDQSNLNAPLPEHLVRDRDFVAQAEALMRRIKKQAKLFGGKIPAPAAMAVHKKCIPFKKFEMAGGKAQLTKASPEKLK